NSSANAFVTDFYRPLWPNWEDGHYLNLSRVMTAFWGLAQVGVALVTLGLHSDRSVIDWVLSVAGFTTGMVLGLFILGSLRRPGGLGCRFRGGVQRLAASHLDAGCGSLALVRPHGCGHNHRDGAVRQSVPESSWTIFRPGRVPPPRPTWTS